MLLYGADARHGLASVYPAAQHGIRCREHGTDLYGVAHGHYGSGTLGGCSGRENPCRLPRADRTSDHDLRPCDAGTAAVESDGFRYYMAACAVRHGIRTLPVAQQQHNDSLGAAAPQRLGKRHARYGATDGPDDGCGVGGILLPLAWGRDDHDTVVCGGSVCLFRGDALGIAHTSSPARGAETKIVC